MRRWHLCKNRGEQGMSCAGSEGKGPGAGSRLSLACERPEESKCPERCIRGEWNREVYR